MHCVHVYNYVHVHACYFRVRLQAAGRRIEAKRRVETNALGPAQRRLKVSAARACVLGARAYRARVRTGRVRTGRMRTGRVDLQR